MQHGLLLLLALVMLLVTTAFAVCNGLGILTLPDAAERALAILCAALAATASAGLLYVGLIARGVPAHEELNVQLNRGNEPTTGLATPSGTPGPTPSTPSASRR